ncbi:unnamed protein product, partial [Symbiodinium pilosum]
APNCTKATSWRFSQRPRMGGEKDLTRQKCLPRYTGVSGGNWHLSRVGGMLVGVSEDKKQPRLLLLNEKDVGKEGVHPQMVPVCAQVPAPKAAFFQRWGRKAKTAKSADVPLICTAKNPGWSQLVASPSGRVGYALPTEGRHILVVNMTQTPLRMSTVKIGRNARAGWKKYILNPLAFGGIAATNSKLYLVPGGGTVFMSMDVAAKNPSL